VEKNQLYYGDNLEVLRQHIKDESVDLIYLDPPFNSRQDYNVLFAEKPALSEVEGAPAPVPRSWPSALRSSSEPLSRVLDGRPHRWGTPKGVETQTKNPQIGTVFAHKKRVALFMVKVIVK
jgi:hypothetical protein